MSNSISLKKKYTKKQKQLIKNYEELFAMSLPHMDTVNDVYQIISPEELERFKVKIVEELLEKKVLHINGGC